MNNIIERLEELNEMFENAISYEDWSMVEDARKELLFLIEDLDSDLPNSSFDDEY